MLPLTSLLVVTLLWNTPVVGVLPLMRDTLPTTPRNMIFGMDGIDTTHFRRSTISRPPKRILLSDQNVANLETIERIIQAVPDSIRAKTPVLVLMISGGGAIHTFHNHAALAATQPAVAQAIKTAGLTPATFWSLQYSAELAVSQVPVFERTKPNSMATGDMLRNAEYVYTHHITAKDLNVDYLEDWGLQETLGDHNVKWKDFDKLDKEPFDPTSCLPPVIEHECAKIATQWQ